ncbi:MAG: YggS family pyridoxal phosphate-dependent enzyme [Syntrophotalea acetylenica]|jgi:pyridoxal phosphate enzyme (YggS family)|uniref:YggS family pyridoxal phosphate-dependent enzyme n=1 Tax=Syntrophotalea TaxID=2812025 RepID=UPI002A35ED7D|nr:YggS family pyridoxal phosphate-dependent enzyme [Syntrophotalea acetylenica]MDD4457993.1 YggS family pyridoxal phosphate-dependent enzyme [Syntrophotalea acetylenica]MDY0261050.1 YggS family pyridoxal phosphate-dependent enzyme [Syntrophotalea acetylenica]
MSIEANLREIRDRIDAACLRIGRNPRDVRLVAVSKTKPAAMIDEAAAAGQTLFGENYVQEFLAKAEQVMAKVEWHFIGSLQSNKVKYLREKVAMIHSVDRLSLAREIDRQWSKAGYPADILIQVNLGEEESKSGTQEAALEELVRSIAALPNVRIGGLMALPPYLDDPEMVRPFFRRLRHLAEKLSALDIPGVAMRELSMGMSHDFEVAIEEGATLVRVGSAIFGSRR